VVVDPGREAELEEERHLFGAGGIDLEKER